MYLLDFLCKSLINYVCLREIVYIIRYTLFLHMRAHIHPPMLRTPCMSMRPVVRAGSMGVLFPQCCENTFMTWVLISITTYPTRPTFLNAYWGMVRNGVLAQYIFCWSYGKRYGYTQGYKIPLWLHSGPSCQRIHEAHAWEESTVCWWIQLFQGTVLFTKHHCLDRRCRTLCFNVYRKFEILCLLDIFLLLYPTLDTMEMASLIAKVTDML